MGRPDGKRALQWTAILMLAAGLYFVHRLKEFLIE